MDDAACKGMAPKNRGDADIFFPGQGESSLANQGMMVCFTCKVVAECRAYSEQTDTKYGVWGAQLNLQYR